MYILVSKDERIRELEEENKMLREEIKNLNEKASSSEDVEELKVNCEYWEKQAKEYSQYCADIVDICYSKIKAAV